MNLPWKTHDLLQLIRPPNLITVPGDPLAGAILALAVGVKGDIIVALVASVVALLLYISGLIMNDYVDVEEDIKDRPSRPLPSGAISPSLAIISSISIALAGVGVAFIINLQTGITSVLLVITITLYNFVFKHDKFVDAISMGLCRGLSFLLGAFAVGYKIADSYVIICVAVAIVFYIASVTAIAANETEEVKIGIKRWLPTASIFLVLLSIGFLAENLTWAFIIPGISAIIISMKIARQLSGEPKPELVQKSIGLYIRILLLIQAAICFMLFPIGVAVGLILLLLWPFGDRLVKKFYAS